MAGEKKADQKQDVKSVDAEFTQHAPCHFTHEGSNYSLFKGESYSLPDCDFVKSLVRKGHLKTASK